MAAVNKLFRVYEDFTDIYVEEDGKWVFSYRDYEMKGNPSERT